MMTNRVRKFPSTTASVNPGPESYGIWGDTHNNLNFSAENDGSSNNYFVPKVKKISISTTPTGSEQDTTFDLPAKALLLDVFVNVTTAEATGTTKTIDIGLKSSESGGDADGFIDGVSVSSTGIKRGQSTVAGGVFTANTRGVLMSDYAVGTNADDRGLYVEKPHSAASVTAKSITYTAGSNNFAEFRGDIYLVYIEL